jgi:hypothetical protein
LLLERLLLERELLFALGLLLERELLVRELELAFGLLLVERELLLALGLLLVEREPLLALGLLLVERELLLALGLLLERELLLAFGLLVERLLPERVLCDFDPLLAPARLLRVVPDFFADDVLVSPFSARSLFTVRAAISAARPFWPFSS